jgi:ribosomal protein S18 acetylase RimI-like enzyme
LSIDPDNEGFKLKWLLSEAELKMSIKDSILQEWMDKPVAYGAFENDRMLGFVEGFHEKWNNRFRISNICIFEEADRKSGIGTMLLEKIMEDAVNSGARMAVLETRSFNLDLARKLCD